EESEPLEEAGETDAVDSDTADMEILADDLDLTEDEPPEIPGSVEEEVVGGGDAAPADEGVSLDLGDIDISDLGPPEEEVMDEALTLDDGMTGSEEVSRGAASAPAGAGAGLAD
mgnify:CR=1